MSKKAIHNNVVKPYSLFNKAHFGEMPRLTAVFLTCAMFLSAAHESFAEAPVEDTSLNVTVVNPVLLSDQPIEETSSTVEVIEVDIINQTENEELFRDITTTATSAISDTTVTSALNSNFPSATNTTEVISTTDLENTTSSTSSVQEVANSSPADGGINLDEKVGVETDDTVSREDSDVEVTSPVVHQSQSDSQVIFDKSNCTMVGQGNFYCSDLSDLDQLRPDGVYSFPDKDGDLEIYIQRGGELKQITHNEVDDASPWFDATTNTIVWHRLIDGRYQIIEYNVLTEQENQLTVGSTNSMEPTRQGQYTAWQAWLDNNWEIVLHDGTDMYRLTHSSEPDLAPQIRNGLLLWYRMQANGERRLELYNIATKERVSMKDDGEGVITNPRMMVVFESQARNGDTMVKGYDIVTGQVVPIGSNPQPVPANIPNPNPTGEPIALFPPNNKSDITADELSELETDEEELSLLTNDFDDDSTLVLFDYGVATSSEENQSATSSAELDESDYTIDMRTDDPYEELTLEIPLFEDNTSIEE